MIELPIDAMIPQIITTLRGHSAMVLVAPPGAGKTTRVPPAIAARGAAFGGASQPDHVAARRVAARAAEARTHRAREWLEPLGGRWAITCGFEKRYGNETKIRILTEAILTRMLLADAALEGIGCVVLDEFPMSAQPAQ